ncbi:hypothetical protein K503DRAFT_734074 [Rhizopogon vinicolor AM-OR11-026]|uniref:F-box domain-containing protein n=1 Tax=Rhizopogon vinicolor AM-OR11-026 TaxID=1314800 RepID=A0A1B7NBK1_9AGAM|nr:hypothetical protein K503DRAFT_734074 [Rhizopogon vinicolor AM-OR11-026]
MVAFLDLPLELLPVIFNSVVSPPHLGSLCLVNNSFNQFAIQKLYQHIYCYAWHNNSKVVLLFRTLSSCPHLARHVSRLEIRVFPKGLPSLEHNKLLDLCIRGIRNCINLRSCAWTRDGSLESAILHALQQCPQLKELEINGHDSGYYNPIILAQFSKLSKISLIMPSAQVIEVLPSWISVVGSTLRSLTIICKASILVTDNLLESLALSMTKLEQFYISGCPRVTDRGVGEIVSTNRNGLTGIGLEGLSQTFDMSNFNSICKGHRAFSRLTSITLTFHINTPLQTWMCDVTELLSTAPLERFQVYAETTISQAPVTDEFWKAIVTMHGSRLKRFSVHRMKISLDALYDICSRCSVLEELFILADRHDLDAVARCFTAAQNLRSIHVNFSFEECGSAEPEFMMNDALHIIQHCPATVTQIGCHTKVWHVKREVRMNDKAELYVEPILTRYESPDIPEQLLVIRM